MQIVNNEWKQHINLSVTQICYCLKLSKADDNIYLTDHDRDMTFLNEIYIADFGLTIKSVKHRMNLQDDGFEISTYLGDLTITNQHINTDFLAGADFTLYQVNWHNVAEYNRVKMGIIGNFSLDNSHLKLNLHGLAKKLESQVGRVLQEKCDAQLGDGRCGLDLPSLDPAIVATGCDKYFETCQNKFDNAAQFRGFAQMPGRDFKFAYPQRLTSVN
ncbi:MAG: DUF2163 domain-containing protein [Rhizobiales bacterium]|nr:DUF2163 domain-containing protein [Hyphomicrobiales bacterium]NRB13387.1 DUF2163 domain-containing protein [Hyphomicrobiales bacterium]